MMCAMCCAARLANHERSKKHRENVALLKHLLAEEEEEMKEAKTTSQSTASESTASLSTTSHVAKSEDSQSSSSDSGSGDGDGEGVEGRGGSEGGEVLLPSIRSCQTTLRRCDIDIDIHRVLSFLQEC